MSQLLGPFTTEIIDMINNEITKKETKEKITSIIKPITDNIINEYSNYIIVFILIQIITIILLLTIIIMLKKS